MSEATRVSSAGAYGPGTVAPVGYDAFYDGFYGPFYDGYWGADGAFYYRAPSDHDWRRDDAQHFRHEAGAGFRRIHSARRWEAARAM